MFTAAASQGQRQATQAFTFPAPVNGIDSLSSLYKMSATSSIYSFNLDATEYGQRIRPGDLEWANGTVGGTVLTVIPYEGVESSGVNDRLFAATSDGFMTLPRLGIRPPQRFWTGP